jgi:uncharacterized protein (UPF0332 family)
MMSLERLSKDGRLKKTPASKQEISDLLAAAECYLGDARVVQVSLDGRFSAAYSAVLQGATALVRCHGYRSVGLGHHATTFTALSVILGTGARGLIAYFDACRSKRNRAQYHRVGLVTEKELAELIEETRQFISLVKTRIADEFPRYSPD